MKFNKPKLPNMKNVKNSGYLFMLVSCLFLLAFCGCATTQSLSIENRSRTYNVDYDKVFNSVVVALAKDGYAVTSADTENGIIVTDERVESTIFSIVPGNRTKVTAIVGRLNNRVTVVLNYSRTQANETGGANTILMPKSMAMGFYNNLFTLIELELN